MEPMERVGFLSCTMETFSCLTHHQATETADSIPIIEGRRFLRYFECLRSGVWPSPNRDPCVGMDSNTFPDLWYGMSQRRDPIGSQHQGAETPCIMTPSPMFRAAEKYFSIWYTMTLLIEQSILSRSMTFVCTFVQEDNHDEPLQSLDRVITAGKNLEF